jgi:hypothetical protein
VLLYEYVGKKTVDLQHTEVPDAYRGRGIAKHLAKVAGLGGGEPEIQPTVLQTVLLNVVLNRVLKFQIEH